MDDKVKHVLRVGDVFLEPDGWARVLMKASLTSDVYLWAHMKEHTLAPTTEYGMLNNMKYVDGCVFLYNLCDMFGDAKKAMQ